MGGAPGEKLRTDKVEELLGLLIQENADRNKNSGYSGVERWILRFLIGVIISVGGFLAKDAKEQLDKLRGGAVTLEQKVDRNSYKANLMDHDVKELTIKAAQNAATIEALKQDLDRKADFRYRAEDAIRDFNLRDQRLNTNERRLEQLEREMKTKR